MSIFDAIGDIFSNETSHIGNMLSSWGKSPGKTLEQFALGAQDPLGAKLWSGVTGQTFTPSVGQMGGETDAQFAQSRKEGVNTGPSQTLGQIANVVAAVWGGSEAAGALGSAAGLGGGAGEGAAAGEGASAGAGAADSGSVNLFADAVPGAGGDVGASAGTAGSATAGASGTSSWLNYGKTAATVLGPTVLSSLLQPKPPKTKAPTAMPDPLAQQQAQQQKLIQQLARRGRASTILTSPGDAGGSLGG